VFNVVDVDTANSAVSLTAYSSDTNIATVAITATNAIGTTNLAFTLTLSARTNVNDTTAIILIATDGALSTTNSFGVVISPVNDAPSFTVSTNLVLVAEDAGTITNANFLTGLSTGPTNESAQTWTFTVTSGTNFSFATAPAIGTNGTLTFRSATNAIGTNTITVVMKDSGGVSGGGVDSVTNTFTIGVIPANDAPTFSGVVSKTILEDATTNTTAVVNAIDTDTASSNLVVTATSSDTNIATVAITSTNLVNSTNAAFTLTFTPKTNANGSVSITLIGNDGALSTTNSFLLTVTAVNDQPDFTVSTNLVLVGEDAGTITNANFLTGLSTGPTNESAQTWTFTVTSGTNFSFATAPAISTNGTLTFRSATNAIGTNTITVVMKDSGGVTGGGVDSVTNTFTIGVIPANDAPTFSGVVSKTILEDATTNNTAVINVIDTDTASSNLVVTATSSDTNIATVVPIAFVAVIATVAMFVSDE
jgi:chemotaxis signal transduction protein